MFQLQMRFLCLQLHLRAQAKTTEEPPGQSTESEKNHCFKQLSSEAIYNVAIDN